MRQNITTFLSQWSSAITMSSPKCPFSLDFIIIIATCHFVIFATRSLTVNAYFLWIKIEAWFEPLHFFISTPGMIDCWGIYLWALNFLLLIWLITSMTYKSLKLSNLTRIQLDQSPSPLSQAFKTWTWTTNVCTQINSYASFCHSFCLNWHKTNSKN